MKVFKGAQSSWFSDKGRKMGARQSSPNLIRNRNTIGSWFKRLLMTVRVVWSLFQLGSEDAADSKINPSRIVSHEEWCFPAMVVVPVGTPCFVSEKSLRSEGVWLDPMGLYLMPLLAEPVWQKWTRSSFKDFAKDIVEWGVYVRESDGY